MTRTINTNKMNDSMNNLIKNTLAALIMLLALIMTSSAMAKASLEKVRVGQTADKTRVVFEIKQNHRFEVSKFNNPPRIVVDFYKADNKLSFKNMKFLDARLEKIRVKDQKNRVRVVLDLRKNFDYNYFVLAKNKQGAERVVIDVSKKLVTAKPVKDKKNVVKSVAKPAKDIAELQKPRQIMNAGSPMFLLKNKDLVVAIDAGHGGKDPGAIGFNGTKEKVVTLQIAKRLKKYIDAQPGMRAILTRDKDEFVSLHQRVRIAHKHNADIFLSIHADACRKRSARGGSVYILSTKGASSVMARILAKSENASLHDIKLKGRDSDVAFVLSDMTREANIRASRKLGEAVLGEMGLSVRLHKTSVQSANFAVLKSIDMPSLLIEAAFLSNIGEEKKLKTTAFQSKVAKSIVRGLEKFVKRNSQQPRWGESLFVYYKVRSGDTLSQIAANYKISTAELKKLNRIKQANQLYVGKKLRIPVS